MSTNLNLRKRIQEIADARPDGVRISLSGFHQDAYEETHAGGNIEEVKENMRELADAVVRNGRRTMLSVLFHRYIDNQADETAMKAYAEELGYKFEPVWAYLMPLEKTLAYAEGAEMSSRDNAIIEKLALPLDDAIDAARRAPIVRCKLRDNQMAITPDGAVSVCCSTYEQPNIAQFLDTDFETIQSRKYTQDICRRCMKHGLHVLSTYGIADQFDAMAVARVREKAPDFDPGTPPSRLTQLAGSGFHRLKRLVIG